MRIYTDRCNNCGKKLTLGNRGVCCVYYCRKCDEERLVKKAISITEESKKERGSNGQQ